MKLKQILPSLLLFAAISFAQISNAQNKGRIPWEVATKDSIIQLLTRFSHSVDLFYDNPVGQMFQTESRENEAGLEMFKKLFCLPGDSACLKKENKLFNFADTAFIRLYNGFKACPGDSCKILFLKELSKYQRELITVDEYILYIKKIYNNEIYDPQFFPGITAKLKDSSIFISKERYKVAAHTYEINAYSKLIFSGYCEKDKTPALIGYEDLDISFRLLFDQDKTPDGLVYHNFRIKEVTPFYGSTPPPPPHSLFSVVPYFSGGLISYSGNLPAGINDHLEKEYSFSEELGFILEKKFPVFEKETGSFKVGIGFSLYNINIASSISDGYQDKNVKPADTSKPFTPSAFISNYSILSDFRDVSFRDRQWMFGFPFRLGVGFSLGPNSNLGGFLHSSVVYYLPFSSATISDGELNQVGKFEYLHREGYPTVVLIPDKDENPFPDYYGLRNTHSDQGVQWNGGLFNRTELGMTFNQKSKNYFQLAPYFTIGSYSLKGDKREYLAETGGEVFSPLQTISRLVVVGYGISFSYSFDIVKQSAK